MRVEPEHPDRPEARSHDDLPDWRSVEWTRHVRESVVGHTRISYVDLGQGAPACLFLHGLGNTWRFWVETMPMVARERRVIAVDLPGFGDSHMPTVRLTARNVAVILEELLDDLGIAEVCICGHSMGALLGLELARRLDRRVARLVIVGGTLVSIMDFYREPLRITLEHPGIITRFLVEALSASVPLTASARRLIAHRMRLRQVALGPYVHHPADLDPFLVEQLLRGLGRRGVLAALVAGLGFDFYAALDALDCPVLIVAGSYDKLGPREDVDAFVKHVPHAQVTLIEDAGHWPMIERPTLVNPALLEFLRQEHPPRRSSMK